LLWLAQQGIVKAIEIVFRAEFFNRINCLWAIEIDSLSARLISHLQVVQSRCFWALQKPAGSSLVFDNVLYPSKQGIQ